MQLIGGEARTLQKGPGLVGDDGDLLALRNRRTDGRKGRAVASGGQRPGVAVGHDRVAVTQQVHARLADGHAGLDILGVHNLGLGQPEGGQLVQAELRMLGPLGLHEAYGPAQVHRRGPGQGDLLQLGREQGPPVAAGRDKALDLARGQVAAIGRSDADGGRAAHHHDHQRLADVVDRFTDEPFLTRGQVALIQQDEGILFRRILNMLGHYLSF